MSANDESAAIFAADGHAVSIVTWFLLVVAFLSIVCRLAVKWNVSHEWAFDDAVVLGALLTDIASGISVSFAAANGLGTPQEKLTADVLNRQLKAEYASFIFYVATLQLAKLSILVFIHALTPVQFHRRCVIALASLIALLWITETFATLFQCSPPKVWSTLDGNSCIDRVAFWRFAGATNILTDVCLILIPVMIVTRIQWSWSKKIMVLSCFGARLLDIAATAAQLYFTPSFNAPDQSQQLWKWLLTAQVIQCVSIMTSCVPYLKPLLDSLPSGMYMSDELRRRGLSTMDYAYSQKSRGNDNKDEESGNRDGADENNGRPRNRGATTYVLREVRSGHSTPKRKSIVAQQRNSQHYTNHPRTANTANTADTELTEATTRVGGVATQPSSKRVSIVDYSRRHSAVVDYQSRRQSAISGVTERARSSDTGMDSMSTYTAEPLPQ